MPLAPIRLHSTMLGKRRYTSKPRQVPAETSAYEENKPDDIVERLEGGRDYIHR